MAQSTRNALVVAIPEDDIEKIKNGGMVQDDKERIVIYKRGTDEQQDFPDGYFIIRMSERAIEKIENSLTVTYGIRQVGEVNEELFVRKGRISDRVGTKKTTKEKLIEDGMSKGDAERFS